MTTLRMCAIATDIAGFKTVQDIWEFNPRRISVRRVKKQMRRWHSACELRLVNLKTGKEKRSLPCEATL